MMIAVDSRIPKLICQLFELRVLPAYQRAEDEVMCLVYSTINQFYSIILLLFLIYIIESILHQIVHSPQTFNLFHINFRYSHFLIHIDDNGRSLVPA